MSTLGSPCRAPVLLLLGYGRSIGGPPRYGRPCQSEVRCRHAGLPSNRIALQLVQQPLEDPHGFGEQASARRAMDGRAGQGPEPHRGGCRPAAHGRSPVQPLPAAAPAPRVHMEEEDEANPRVSIRSSPASWKSPSDFTLAEQQRCRIDSLWLAPHARRLAHEPCGARATVLRRSRARSRRWSSDSARSSSPAWNIATPRSGTSSSQVRSSDAGSERARSSRLIAARESPRRNASRPAEVRTCVLGRRAREPRRRLRSARRGTGRPARGGSPGTPHRRPAHPSPPRARRRGERGARTASPSTAPRRRHRG